MGTSNGRRRVRRVADVEEAVASRGEEAPTAEAAAEAGAAVEAPGLGLEAGGAADDSDEGEDADGPDPPASRAVAYAGSPLD